MYYMYLKVLCDGHVFLTRMTRYDFIEPHGILVSSIKGFRNSSLCLHLFIFFFLFPCNFINLLIVTLDQL